MSALKVDNRETPKSQTNRTGNVLSFVVGPSMRDSIRHPLDRLSINGSAGHKIVLTADSTHKNALGIIPGLWKTQISVLTEYRRRHGSHQKPSSDCGNLCH